MKTKVFAFYLPQFHVIPENSEFWGEGFTDWVSVRQSEILFKNHIQPKKPLEDNYYDLSNPNVIEWQANLAKDSGITGFGIYHYWFNDEKNLLTKPAENLLNNKDIDINYFFAWDNASWRRTWSKIEGNDWSPLNDTNKKIGPSVLIQYDLGNKDSWKKHFDYLLPFFKDPRYEKNNNKPIFLIYNFSNDILKMRDYWNDLAVINGFNGIDIIFKYDYERDIPRSEKCYFYQPLQSGWTGWFHKQKQRLWKYGKIKKVMLYSYDRIWKKIIDLAKKNSKNNFYYGAFVNYDDTPRRGVKGKCVVNGTPQKFGKYFKILYDECCHQDKEYLFLTAWNEWGEGAFLEPDSMNKYGYLNEIKKVLKNKE